LLSGKILINAKLTFALAFVFELALAFAFDLAPNGLRYPRWGGGRRSRPTGKMIRRRKLLEIFARIPSVGCTLCWVAFMLTKTIAEKKTAANTPNFYTQLIF